MLNHLSFYRLPMTNKRLEQFEFLCGSFTHMLTSLFKALAIHMLHHKQYLMEQQGCASHVFTILVTELSR